MSLTNGILEQKNDALTRLQKSLANNELVQCSLCSKIFNEPIILNCCASRYCLKCLQNYNRSNGQTCPNCLLPFGNNKPFVVDNTFASVIQLTKLDINQPCSSHSSDLFNRILPCKSIDEDLNSELVNLVLWPDASIYNTPLPLCIKRPRFIQVIEKTTVAQLAEYLFLRMEIESNMTGFRSQYKVEFTNVIKELENVDGNYLPKKSKLLHRNSMNQALNEDVARASVMLTIKNSFEPLDAELNVQQMLDHFWFDMSRPFKLLFRFTLFDCLNK